MSERRARVADGAGERLHKVLAREGWGSRREIERWIEAGRIRVNDHNAVTGERVKTGDRVQLDDGRTLKVATPSDPIRVLLLNKPAGVVCTRHDPDGRPDIFERLPRLEHGRWINIGRLDINTSGLLLFSNHGELAHRLMHPRYRIDREYAVRVYGEIESETLVRLREGVDIDGEKLHFDDIVVGEGEGTNHWYYCVVQSGRNREVRRLWESQGVQVSRLIRVRFANVMLPTNLRSGGTVELGGAILSELCALVGVTQATNGAQARTRHR